MLTCDWLTVQTHCSLNLCSSLPPPPFLPPSNAVLSVKYHLRICQLLYWEHMLLWKLNTQLSSRKYFKPRQQNMCTPTLIAMIAASKIDLNFNYVAQTSMHFPISLREEDKELLPNIFWNKTLFNCSISMMNYEKWQFWSFVINRSTKCWTVKNISFLPSE